MWYFKKTSVLHIIRYTYVIYIYIYTYILSLPLSLYVYIYIYICIYGGFPRPVTTKYAKADTFYERNEESIPYESKIHRGSMKQAYPTLLGMLAWYASGYA